MPKRKASQLGYLTKQNENEYSIWLYGAVGWEFNSKSFIQDINNLPSGVTTLNLYVNSPGGLVDEGYAILTNIQRIKQRLTVVTHTDAMAYSMGSALVSSGDKHIMSPTSRMMIHNPWIFIDIFGGHNSEEIEGLIEWLEGLKEQLDQNTEILAGAYQKRLKMPVSDILDKYFDGKDHYLSPEECLELGLCDEIMDFEIDESFSEEMEDLNSLGTEQKDYKIAAFGEEYGEQYLRDKKVFDYNIQNHEIKGRQKFTTKSGDMDLLEFAKALGISEDRAKKISDEDILTEARKVSGQVDNLRTENKNLKELNTDLEQRKDTLETENKDLKQKTVEYDAKQISDKAIKEVEGDAKNKGKKVNSNIVEEIESRAIDYVNAESEDEQEQIFDHMKLKAQNALVPLGSDPDLADDAKSRGTGEEANKEEKFDKAAERGKAKREKMEKRQQKRQTIRQ